MVNARIFLTRIQIKMLHKWPLSRWFLTLNKDVYIFVYVRIHANEFTHKIWPDTFEMFLMLRVHTASSHTIKNSHEELRKHGSAFIFGQLKHSPAVNNNPMRASK